MLGPCVYILLAAVIPAATQTAQFELADAVQVDSADHATLASLQQAKAYLADRQWSRAIDTYQQVLENAAGMLLQVTPQRYIRVSDECNQQLAAMPAEALAIYRSRVDPLARKWYEEGIARLDRELLTKVVDQAFASSWGDRALLALGELALESGDTTAARWYWERGISYPGTKLDLAAVRARLVLVSILEGAQSRANEELAQFVRLHGDTPGRFGGRDAPYAQTLKTLLTENVSKPSQSAPIDVNHVAWRIPLGSSQPERKTLPYYPAVVGQHVLVCNRAEVLAVDLATGKPAWSEHTAAIYREQLDGTATWSADPIDRLGTTRHTLTASDGKLFARMGSSITGWPQTADNPTRPSTIVCLDLEREGQLLRKLTATAGWAFEGSPLVRGANVYVAMRRNDIRPQAHVACFDVQTGALRWRRFICAAETPARGMLYECTHNLLTLDHDTLYYNTNLGAVATLSASDGQLRWVTLYPRDRQGDLRRLAAHWRRDLNPCLFYRGMLLVAPADSSCIFAIDAASGQMLWQTSDEVGGAMHLLGVAHDRLLASGDRLYWINLTGLSPGKVVRRWPDSNEKLGFGRGVLCGNDVYFPTQENICVFNASTAEPRKLIDLAPFHTSGGNLVIVGDHLLIATTKELVALATLSLRGSAVRLGLMPPREPNTNQ